MLLKSIYFVESNLSFPDQRLGESTRGYKFLLFIHLCKMNLRENFPIEKKIKQNLI